MSAANDPTMNRWRVATFSSGFMLLLVCAAWVMREQSVAQDRRREREQWEADRRLSAELREEQSREIGRLDLTVDEARAPHGLDFASS